MLEKLLELRKPFLLLFPPWKPEVISLKKKQLLLISLPIKLIFNWLLSTRMFADRALWLPQSPVPYYLFALQSILFHFYE